MESFQRFKDSSHPIALLSFVAFRALPIVIYLVGSLFLPDFIFQFITVLLLLCVDFWNVKNISGRLLVGLRWWNEVNEDGSTVWVFETAPEERVLNPVDSNLFWLLLYTSPVVWVVFGFVCLLKFQLLYLTLVIAAIILQSINAMAYTRCNKSKVSNNITQGIVGSLISRIVPW